MREEFVTIQEADRRQRDHHHADGNPRPDSFAPSPNLRETHGYSRSLSLPFFEIAQQLGGALVARAGIALQAFAYNVAERARNRLIMSGDRQRAFLRTLDQAGDDALGLERSFAGQ